MAVAGNGLLALLTTALATALVAVTITRASVFQGLRVWLKARNTLLKQLLSCTYCFSHWVGAALVWLFNTPVTLRHFLFAWLVVVALAQPLIAGIYHTATSIGPAAEDRDPEETA